MTAPRRIEIAGDAGWGGLGCGIPLALLASAAFSIEAPRQGAWVIGALLAAIAVLAVFGRDRLIVDADAGQVVSWQGLLRPMRVHSRPLRDFDRVAVHCWIRGTPARLDHVTNLSKLSFPIRLEGSSEAILLEFQHDYATGRARAEEIARTLGLPLEDDCRGVAVEAPAPSALPASSGIIAHRQPELTVFDLPAKPVDLGVGLRILVSLAVPLTFLVLALAAPWIPERFPGEGGRAQAVCFVVSLLTFPLAVLPIVWALSRRERVALDGRVLRVQWVTRISAGKREADAIQVSELLIQASSSDTQRFLRLPGLVLAARIGDRALEFGAGLELAELAWLQREIEAVLPKPADTRPSDPGSVERGGEAATGPEEVRHPWRPAMPAWPRE